MTHLPLLMLPLRLETRLTEDRASRLVVDIRAYPDQIHVDSARRTMSPSEQLALRDLAKAHSESAEAFAAAKLRIAPALGTGRLEFLWSAKMSGTLPPVSEADWDEAPVARALPERLLAVVRSLDGRTMTAVGEPLPEAIPMAPAQGDTRAFSGADDDPLLWMSDFEEAQRIGLAFRVYLERGVYFSNIASIEVIGIPGERYAEEDGRRFAALLSAQRQSVGVGLHAAGKATKTEKATLRGQSRKDHLSIEAALGLAEGVLAASAARVDGNAATQPCARLVWAAAMQPALLQGWHLEDGKARESGRWMELMEERFINQLHPEGAFPVLSVGKQPYGIHVMCSPQARAHDIISASVRKSMPDLAKAAQERRDTLHNRRGDWAALLDHLTRADQSGTWRTRRLHPLAAWINVAITANMPSSSAVFQAPLSRRDKLDQLDLGRFAVGKAGVTIAADPNNRLLNLPLVAAEAEHSDAPLRLRALGALLDSPLDTFYDKVQRHSTVSVLHLLAQSALCWGILDYAALLRTRGDRDAAHRVLGYDVDHNSEHSAWQPLIQGVFGTRARGMSVTKLLDHFPPRTLEQNKSADALRALAEALEAIQDLPAWQVHRALAGALDAASSRFDVWESADALQVLKKSRAHSPEGLALGAYGFMEGNGIGAPGDPAVFRVAPSIEHAATAAALHQAKDALDASGDGAIADIELSSQRVRMGLDLAKGMRRGQDPADTLGRFAEQFLASAGRSELAPALARALPLRGTAEPEDAILRIDGLRLLALAHDGTLGALEAPFDSGRARLSEGLGEYLLRALSAAVIAASDSYADLCTAEGLHRLMNGRPEAAQAAFEALGGGGAPPQDFAVVDTKPSGHALGTSIALLAEPVPGAPGTLDSVVPGLAPLLEALLPPLVGRITVVVETLSGRETLRLPLAGLGLTVMELIVAARPDNGLETVLRPAARLAVAANDSVGKLESLSLDEDAEDWWWAAGRAAALLFDARPLSRDDVPGATLRDEAAHKAEQAAARELAGDALGVALQRANAHAATLPVLAVRTLLRLGDSVAADALSERVFAGDVGDEFVSEIAALVTAHLSTAPQDRVDKLLPGLPTPPRFVIAESRTCRAVHLPEQSAVLQWLEGIQEIEPKLWPLSDLLLAGADARLSQRALQGAAGIERNAIPAQWLGGKIDPATLSHSLDGLLTFSPKPIGDGKEVIGLQIVAWRELLARPEADIGVSARVPMPPARAPNSLVLVTPQESERWSPETILDCLGHLRAQIKARSIDLESLPGHTPSPAGEPLSDNLGLFLPLLWVPPTPVGDSEFL